MSGLAGKCECQTRYCSLLIYMKVYIHTSRKQAKTTTITPRIEKYTCHALSLSHRVLERPTDSGVCAIVKIVSNIPVVVAQPFSFHLNTAELRRILCDSLSARETNMDYDRN